MRLLFLLPLCVAAAHGGVTIHYPADGSVFPPDMSAPTVIWSHRDGAAWRAEIVFGDGGAPVSVPLRGDFYQPGAIDPDTAGSTNQPPRVPPGWEGARAWKPDAALWSAIKRRSVNAPASVAVIGYRDAARTQPLARATVRISTSRDAVGAPIFYRDVPLMPSETERGVIKPLSTLAIPLVKWQLRWVGQERSRVVMDDLPTCANCHSFSADGKTMGMDLDGLHGNRGLYFLAPIGKQVTVDASALLQWRSASGPIDASIRAGFMSQVSPDGRYVATTVDPHALAGQSTGSNYYVANFKDYRFLQVFFPTRGVLCWYSRETGVLKPLPGADDARFVQYGGVWSPDARYLVFARAAAMEPYAKDAPAAQFAGDPNERQIRYGLYRVPFNNGAGGRAEPIAGASENGFSNTFPKVSPDGRWIVFVRCGNGQLMRPDSELYIVPAAGGVARRMRANQKPMNSWHSFSPNGRWLAFSSKARGPYTQLYLTHIDADGNDTPAILVENTTASNRAVNIPEFVNAAAGGFERIGGEALDLYRYYDSAVYMQKRRRYSEAIPLWQKVLASVPGDVHAHENLATALMLTGRRAEAAVHLQKARELKARAK